MQLKVIHNVLTVVTEEHTNINVKFLDIYSIVLKLIVRGTTSQAVVPQLTVPSVEESTLTCTLFLMLSHVLCKLLCMVGCEAAFDACISRVIVFLEMLVQCLQSCEF